jgi:hypothetical protein
MRCTACVEWALSRTTASDRVNQFRNKQILRRELRTWGDRNRILVCSKISTRSVWGGRSRSVVNAPSRRGDCDEHPQKVNGNENEGFPRILTSPDINSIRKNFSHLSQPFPNPASSSFNPFSDPEASCNSFAKPSPRRPTSSSIPHSSFSLKKKDAPVLELT